ncbi:MAG: hypothetical protein J6I45_09070, partial [Clostridia bacterium]|nr:hypothetical protein [Clostridia bacterium]
MRQPPDIDFTGQRPPFQGVLCPETNQYTPQNRKFCGGAVANKNLQQPLLLLHLYISRFSTFEILR